VATQNAPAPPAVRTLRPTSSPEPTRLIALYLQRRAPLLHEYSWSTGSGSIWLVTYRLVSSIYYVVTWTANQTGLVTLTFDLLTLKVCPSHVWRELHLCANFGLPRPRCSRLTPSVCDRHPTDVRRLLGAGHKKRRIIKQPCTVSQATAFVRHSCQQKTELETKASSHEWQCIPARSSVSLPRRVLITVLIITMRSIFRKLCVQWVDTKKGHWWRQEGLPAELLLCTRKVILINFRRQRPSPWTMERKT